MAPTRNERWKAARRLYEDGTARIVDLADTLGVTHQAVSRRKRVEGWWNPNPAATPTAPVAPWGPADEPNMLIVDGEAVRVSTRTHPDSSPTYQADVSVRMPLGYCWRCVNGQWWAMPVDGQRVGPYDDIEHALAGLLDHDTSKEI